MKLSLTGFKKVKSEGNTTTLRHPAGHEMTINHSILSPKLRGDIAALPSEQKDSEGNKHPDKSSMPQLAGGGMTAPSPEAFSSSVKQGFDGPAKPSASSEPVGYVKSSYTPEQEPIDQAEKDRVSASQKYQRETYGEAEGGEIKKYAKSGETKPATNEAETYSEMQRYAEGDEVKSDNGPEAADKRVTDQNNAQAAKDTQDKADALEKDKYERAGMGSDYLAKAHADIASAHKVLVQSQAGQPQQPSQPDQSQDWQGSRGVVSSPNDNDPTNITANAIPGADQTAAGQPKQNAQQPVQQPVTPVTAATQPQTGIPGYDKSMADARKSAIDYQTYAQTEQKKDQNLYDAAIANKVDPNRLVNNRDTISKIGNVIGLVLGGLSAGHTGGKNLAIGVINDAIEKDIEAQKSNQTNNMNAYKMNLEATGNELQAKAVTTNQFLTLAQAAIAKQVAGNNNLAAQQQVQLLTQQIQAAKDNNTMNAYKMKTLNDLSSGSSAPQQNGIDQKRFNELKLSNVMPKEDVTAATKEAQNYQEAQKLQQDMEGSAKHLDEQIGAGILTPSDRNSAINAFAGRIAKIAEGKFNLEESKLQAQALLPSPGDLPSTVKNKAKRRAQFFDSLTPTTTLEGYGIKSPSQPSTETKTMNGVQYKKVNGGWQKQ